MWTEGRKHLSKTCPFSARTWFDLADSCFRLNRHVMLLEAHRELTSIKNKNTFREACTAGMTGYRSIECVSVLLGWVQHSDGILITTHTHKFPGTYKASQGRFRKNYILSYAENFQYENVLRQCSKGNQKKTTWNWIPDELLFIQRSTRITAQWEITQNAPHSRT